MKHRFAIVLPAYNEAAGLEMLLWRITRALDGHDYEIVLVDDGSTDATAAIAETLSEQMPIHLVRHGVNQGYGAAIRTGVLEARSRADVVVTMDADDSHDPSLIPLMMYGIACGSDVIVASRFVPGGREVGVPLHRMLLSRGAAVVFGRLLNIDDVHDYTSGYRAYRSSFLDRLVDVLGEEGLARETGFTVGVELLLKADRAGGRLAEVPLVLRYDRKRSESKLDIQKTMGEYVRLLRRVKEETKLDEMGREEEKLQDRPGIELGDGMWATAAADVATIFVSFALSWLFYRLIVDLGLLNRGYPEIGRYAGLAALYASTTVVVFWRFGLYMPRLTALHLRHLQLVGQALTISVALFFAVLFFATGNHPSRLLVLAAITASYPLMFLSRRVMTGWLRQRRLEKRHVSRALIYGAGWTGRLLMKKILEAPRLGTQVVGFLDDSSPIGSQISQRISRISSDEISVDVLGTGSDLSRVVKETGATDLYLAVPDLTDSKMAAIRAETEALGIDLGIVPRMGAVRPDQLQVDDLGAVPVLRLHRERQHPLYDVAKRALDLVLIVLLLPTAIPLALLTALAIWIDGGPVLFRQTRIGLNGRPFTVLKFRTMRTDADPYAGSPANDRDHRITRVGRYVRMAGLDELPQLVNVWRGEMSLVGPRPEMPHIVADYTELERQRLAVRPGISGLWQLSPNRSQAIHDNLEYDLYYLRQNRLSFDLLIIGETILFVGKVLLQSIVDLPAGLSSHLSRTAAEDSKPIDSRSRSFVLVALDQRRRPDEPASWRRYVPMVGALAGDVRVLVLAAQRNSARIRELAGDAESQSSAIEYVSYGEASSLRELAQRASVIVTDLPYLAEQAKELSGAVLVVEGTEARLAPHSEGDGTLTRRVQSAFANDADELKMAQ